MKNSPTTAMRSSGTNLRTVVTTCTPPPWRTPAMLTAVASHTRPIAIRAVTQLVEAFGQYTLRYPAKATAIAALPAQTAIQYPQAVWKPTKSPNARWAYAYGPPDLGMAPPSRANTSPRSSAPAPVNTHARIEIGPAALASAAGSRKTPEPTIFPITSAVAVRVPIERLSVGVGDCSVI